MRGHAESGAPENVPTRERKSWRSNSAQIADKRGSDNSLPEFSMLIHDHPHLSAVKKFTYCTRKAVTNCTPELSLTRKMFKPVT